MARSRAAPKATSSTKSGTSKGPTQRKGRGGRRPAKKPIDPNQKKIDPKTSLTEPKISKKWTHDDVKVDFQLFFDRPTRDEANHVVEIGTNYCRVRYRDINMEVEEGLKVAKLGKLAVDQTLRLQTASHYAVDSASILNHQPHENRLEPVNLEDASVIDGTHYNLVLYRI